MCILPKIHKRLFDIPRCPVTFNCRTLTEKLSQFLDYRLQSVMKGGISYVNDLQDFLEKLKNLLKLSNAILDAADVIGSLSQYPS